MKKFEKKLKKVYWPNAGDILAFITGCVIVGWIAYLFLEKLFS